ncbi:MAG: hypothetical protein QXU97_00645 [Fervidicoccaceae archaeon]
MENRKALSILLVALLILPIAVVPTARAEAPTIETSADRHGGRIWNLSWLEVKVVDPSMRGARNATVTIYANGTPLPTAHLPDGAVLLREVGTSGIFYGYFFINDTTVSVPAVNTTEGINVRLLPERNLTDALYNLSAPGGTKLTFEYYGPGGRVYVDVKVEETIATLSLDRAVVPPFNNTAIYIEVYDQDYNRDPTKKDTIIAEFSVSLVYLDGRVRPDDTSLSTLTIELSETDANSARFRGSIMLEEDIIDTLTSVLSSLGITGRWKTTYDVAGAEYKVLNLTNFTLDAVPLKSVKLKFLNETRETVEAEFSFKSYPGLITRPASTDVVSTETELLIRVSDPDMNIDTSKKDSLNVNVTLLVWNGSAYVTIGPLTVNLKETGDNTGEFSGKVPLALRTSGADVTDSKIYVNFSSADRPAKLNVTYVDPSEDEGKKTSEVVVSMTSYAPTLTAEPATVLPKGKVTLTLIDRDLNDEGDDVKDSFGQTIQPNTILKDCGIGTPARGNLTVTVDGKPTNATKTFFLFFDEVSPGVFKATFDLSVLNETLKDGSKVVFKWYDPYTNATASATVTVTIPAVTVSLDRATYPMPNDGVFEVIITVNNPYENVNPGVIDKIKLTQLNLTLWNGTSLVVGSDIELTETDVDTGVFKGTATVNLTDLLGIKVYEATGAKLTAAYDYEGTTYKAEATIAPSTAELRVNATTVAMGDYIKVTVVEPDANKDSGAVNEIEVDVTVDGKFLGTLTLKETGKNTGVFEKTLRVGFDDLSNVRAGQKIKFSYTDGYTAATSVTAKRSAELEASVSVKSTTADVWLGTADVRLAELSPFTKVGVYLYDPDLIVYWEKGTLTLSKDYEIYVRSGISEEWINTLSAVPGKPGLFNATLALNLTVTDGKRLDVTVPDTIVLRYLDEVGADGKVAPILLTAKVVAYDGVVWVEPKKPFYNDKEDIVIYVRDPDANRDPANIESVDVRITSPIDPAGATVTLVETGANTGVFRAPLTLLSIESGGLRPAFRVGDKLTITYTDKIGADGKEKKISIEIQVGYKPVLPVTPPAPANVTFVDVTGAPTAPAAGKPMLLRMPVTNADTTRSVAVDVVLLIKTPDGVPIGISYARITLGPGETALAAVGWIPPAEGTFLATAYFWDLAAKTPLSEKPLELTITVG